MRGTAVRIPHQRAYSPQYQRIALAGGIDRAVVSSVATFVVPAILRSIAGTYLGTGFISEAAMSKKDSPALRDEERRASLLSESSVGKAEWQGFRRRTGKASLAIPGRADSLSRAHRHAIGGSENSVYPDTPQIDLRAVKRPRCQ